MLVNPKHPRIAPVEPPYTSELEERLRRWMPPGTEAVEPLTLFRTLARHEKLMSRMLPLGSGILGAGARVEPRDREVMIHRTSARTGAEYEWGVHAVVFALADELHDTSTISDDLFARLQRHFTDDQILELTVTAGWYHVIAYVINAAGLLPEPWALPFPSS